MEHALHLILLIYFVSSFIIGNVDSAEISSDQLITTTDHYLIQKNDKLNKIIQQPTGLFAAMLFQEYALAIHVGIIYYDQMGNPADGKRWISERFWHDRVWGREADFIKTRLEADYAKGFVSGQKMQQFADKYYGGNMQSMFKAETGWQYSRIMGAVSKAQQQGWNRVQNLTCLRWRPQKPVLAEMTDR